MKILLILILGVIVEGEKPPGRQPEDQARPLIIGSGDFGRVTPIDLKHPKVQKWLALKTMDALTDEAMKCRTFVEVGYVAYVMRKKFGFVPESVKAHFEKLYKAVPSKQRKLEHYFAIQQLTGYLF